MFPLASTVATNAYTYFNRDNFLTGTSKPQLWVYLLQMFTSLVVGITSASWICSGRSLLAWKSCLGRLAPRNAYHRPQVKCPPPVTRYPVVPHQQIALTHQPVRTSIRHPPTKHYRDMRGSIRSGSYHRGEPIV